jgi:hypothetical protein
MDDVFGDPELIYVKYTWDKPDDCDYDDADDYAPIHRCEIRVEITCPDGFSRDCDFLIPATVPRSGSGMWADPKSFFHCSRSTVRGGMRLP